VAGGVIVFVGGGEGVGVGTEVEAGRVFVGVGEVRAGSTAMCAVTEACNEMIGWAAGVDDAMKAARLCIAGLNRKNAARPTAPKIKRVRMTIISGFLFVSPR